MSNNLTGVTVSNTYGRLVQVVDGYYYDGFGNPLDLVVGSVDLQVALDSKEDVGVAQNLLNTHESSFPHPTQDQKDAMDYAVTSANATNPFITLADISLGLSGVVPYTGATDNVNLNNQSLVNVSKLGLGVISPSASLHIKASNGTDGTAPIVFTAGTKLTNTKPGALEYDGTDLFITNNTDRFRLLNIGSTFSISNVVNLQTELNNRSLVGHTHSISNIDNLQTELNNRSLVGHTHSIADTIGLQSALDNISNTLGSHTHSIADTIGLQTELNNRSLVGHTHSVSDIIGLTTSLADRSLVGHTHSISDTIGLQTELNNRSLVGHTHSQTDIIGLTTSLANRSLIGHTHSISNIDNLQTELNNRSLVGHTHSISDTIGLQSVLDNISNTLGSHTHSIVDIQNLQSTLDLKADLVAGKIPAAQLPSYVDDVLDFGSTASFPAIGETSKIYIALDNNKTYRWSGSVYVEVSPSDVNSVNGQTGIINLTTTDVPEGTNLYYTDGRVAVASITLSNKVISGDNNTITNISTSSLSDNIVTNVKLAGMSQSTIKGRVGVTGGNPEDLTVDQVRTMLNISNVDNTSDATKNSATASLTNKTLISPIITTQLTGDITPNTINVSNKIVSETGTQSLTNKTLVSPIITTQLTGDITPNTINVSNKIVSETGTQSLTNKTLVSPIITTQLTGDITPNTINVSNKIVSETGTQSLTNKTLISSVLNTQLTGDITPNTINVSNKIVSETGTQSLINKTISGTANNITNIGTTSLVDGSVTNVKLANMATKTYKGRTSAGTGVPEDVTVSQLRSDLSINNVDNTSDLNKPISTATQVALDTKQATLVSGTNIRTVNGNSLLGSGDVFISNVTDSIIKEEFIYTGGTQSIVVSNTITQIVSISVNGMELRTSQYTVTSPSTVTITNPLDINDSIIITYNLAIVTGVINEINRDEFTYTSGSQSFTTSATIHALISVGVNGLVLVPSQYTATSNNVTILETLEANDNILITYNISTSVASVGNITGLQSALDSKYDASNPNGYETPSQLNTRDTNNRNRANHTGTQSASTISDFDSKVAETAILKTTSPSPINGLWSGTQAQYDAIPVKDPAIIYFIQ